ncbi:MAG: hypothetical protein AVDCRST_MAG32-2468, partial [uncultured Nocardioides sp.]
GGAVWWCWRSEERRAKRCGPTMPGCPGCSPPSWEENSFTESDHRSASARRSGPGESRGSGGHVL